jgi:ParB family transcriptional regulator, chromosome partitioning protein
MALSEVKSKKGSKHRDGKHQSRRRTGNTALPTLEKIAVEDVEVIGKHREVDPEKVESLAASMAKIGLRTPITVRRIEKGLGTTVFALVAGRHRLEAARSLGWEHIDAFIMEGNDNDARIWQLMENLYRADLTPLQRAEHVVELIQLVRDGEKGTQAAHPGGQQPHDRGISRAAKILGFTREEVRRSLEIAGISAEAKATAKEKGLDKKQSALLKIAKQKGSDAQLTKIGEIETGKSASASKAPSNSVTKKSKKKANGAELKKSEEPDIADAEVANSPSIVPDSEDADSNSEYPALPASLDRSRGNDERLFTALKVAWDNAPRSVRKRFVTEVLNANLEV